jgi:hypothetical protein
LKTMKSKQGRNNPIQKRHREQSDNQQGIDHSEEDDKEQVY